MRLELASGDFRKLRSVPQVRYDSRSVRQRISKIQLFKFLVVNPPAVWLAAMAVALYVLDEPFGYGASHRSGVSVFGAETYRR